jgi:hypothetical protein
VKQVTGAANHQQSRIPASNRAATVLTGLPGGGLPELRKLLAAEGYPDPLWYEVPKSRKAPKYARRALKHGADVLSSGAATGRFSAASTPWRGRARCWRSSRPARRICWPRT